MSGLETAARVAALREKASRARFAAAGMRSTAALDAARAAGDHLAALPEAVGGAADAFSSWRRHAEFRAGAVRAAEGATVAAAADKAAALHEWQELSRRREALDEVLVRARQAQQAKVDAAAQRLMDDLSRRRKGWS